MSILWLRVDVLEWLFRQFLRAFAIRCLLRFGQRPTSTTYIGCYNAHIFLVSSVVVFPDTDFVYMICAVFAVFWYCLTAVFDDYQLQYFFRKQFYGTSRYCPQLALKAQVLRLQGVNKNNSKAMSRPWACTQFFRLEFVRLLQNHKCLTVIILTNRLSNFLSKFFFK